MLSLPLPVAAFIAGLLSFLSPCVLPLVPGYVSTISGVAVQELKRPDARLRKMVMLNSLAFIMGFSLVFIALGVVAGSLGQFAERHVDLLSKIAGAIIIIFGLHKTGLLPINVLYRDKRLHGIAKGGTIARSFLMGFAFAFGWAPCAGPILAAVLTVAASEATINMGIVLLAIYSLGLAVPFFLTSIAIERFLAFYSRFRRHLHKLEIAIGILLVIVGMLIFTRHFTVINSWMNEIPLFRDMADYFL